MPSLKVMKPYFTSPPVHLYIRLVILRLSVLIILNFFPLPECRWLSLRYFILLLMYSFYIFSPRLNLCGLCPYYKWKPQYVHVHMDSKGWPSLVPRYTCYLLLSELHWHFFVKKSKLWSFAHNSAKDCIFPCPPQEKNQGQKNENISGLAG